MKRIILLIFFIYPFAQFAEAKELKNPEQLSQVLKTSFPLFHGWINKCQTETYIFKLDCNKTHESHLVACVGKGLDENADYQEVKIDDGRELIKALSESGVSTKDGVHLTNLSCLNEHSGFADCGSGVDITTCFLD